MNFEGSCTLDSNEPKITVSKMIDAIKEIQSIPGCTLNKIEVTKEEWESILKFPKVDCVPDVNEMYGLKSTQFMGVEIVHPRAKFKSKE